MASPVPRLSTRTTSEEVPLAPPGNSRRPDTDSSCAVAPLGANTNVQYVPESDAGMDRHRLRHRDRLVECGVAVDDHRPIRPGGGDRGLYGRLVRRNDHGGGTGPRRSETDRDACQQLADRSHAHGNSVRGLLADPFEIDERRMGSTHALIAPVV